MRISTGIALGSTMIKPLAGRHLNEDRSAGCAWGMVSMATPNEADRLINEGMDIKIMLPCGCKGNIIGSGLCLVNRPDGTDTLTMGIVHLFNDHVMTKKDWTMERLIDWVRTVEPADPEEDAHAANPQTVPRRDEVLSLR